MIFSSWQDSSCPKAKIPGDVQDPSRGPQFVDGVQDAVEDDKGQRGKDEAPDPSLDNPAHLQRQLGTAGDTHAEKAM